MGNKYFYLIRGSKEETYADFSQRIMALAGSVAAETVSRAVSVTLTDNPPPVISMIPFRKKKLGAISVYTETEWLSDGIMITSGFVGVYRVSEAFPVKYDRTWPDGERTPGVCLLTLFRKKRGLGNEAFLDRWHNSHTPLSLKIHPLWHYNRNVVDELPVGDAEPWDGIVEEHFRTRSELLNPAKFFGGPLTMLYHMMEVYMDTRSFLDYGTIEPYLVSEYHMKT